jgi:hypothetical protein
MTLRRSLERLLPFITAAVPGGFRIFVLGIAKNLIQRSHQNQTEHFPPIWNGNGQRGDKQRDC